ncbi:methyl-accepting chemotaxis protein [Melittangium boletus DSM 14713]|uniref:Methyl-accepting chemotaxis protein n=2 Tax=Melittangium boletus TaxID=83453 RepID=A0A250ID47_9BACT|nr:methyl-accepting chemotaxis protein [Melittangium boletus DSM 14713]
METYRDFQWERAPARLSQLAWLGLGLTPLWFLLDVLHMNGVQVHGRMPDDAVWGVAALVRLPWGLLPLAVLAAGERMSRAVLPTVMFWATALFALGNEWAFHRLGLSGTRYHAVGLLIDLLLAPSLMPSGRSERFGFYALFALMHGLFTAVWSTVSLTAQFVTDAPVLLAAVLGALALESLRASHIRNFHLRRDTTRTLAELERSRGRVVQTGRVLADSALVLSSTLEDMAEQAALVRVAALRISSASEQMASAAGALFRHSRASATQADEAQRYTGEVDGLVNGLESGLSAIGHAVGRSALSVQKLEESSDRIHGFVETIQEMAAATNMLALNAGIEAARAGEHGRGFAVVAREVSKLAAESGRSSARISEVMGGVTGQMSETLHAVGLIRETSERFTPLLESARTTLRSIRETVQQNQKLMEKSSGEAERQAEQTAHISQACATLLELVDTYVRMGTDLSATARRLGTMGDELAGLLPEPGPRGPSRT